MCGGSEAAPDLFGAGSVPGGHWRLISLSEATMSCHVTSQRFVGCLGAAQNAQLAQSTHPLGFTLGNSSSPLYHLPKQ